jgi:hypothetical protein
VSGFKIGIISDTHRDFQTAYRAIEKMGKIDYLFHAGDYVGDAEDLAYCLDIPIIAVLGNGDYGRPGHYEQFITLNGCRIWLTHGHLYGVKAGLNRLVQQAKKNEADLVIYGHTHLADVQKIDGITFLNPGSIRYPLSSKGPSFAIADIDAGKKINIHTFYLNS